MAAEAASGKHRRILLLVLLLLGPWEVEAALSGPHITDLNVLLPSCTTNPVEYRLQGSGGCFSWSWDHHDILLVEPEYNGSSQCSTSARLISIAPYSGRQETSVYARDVRTGTVIRCEVFIDRISRIRIFHHSVKLDLEGLTTLHIHAFDEQENVFSSLVGLKFLWELMGKSEETNDIHYLAHVPLKETPLSDCVGFCGGLETRIKLEDEGVASDLYVVKGIGIGLEIVSARSLEPDFEHLSDSIVITVVELMSIDPPSPVYVTKGTTISYNLRVIRLNTPHMIDLPSPYHRWSIVNASVALIDNTRGTAQALNLGYTDIIVEDTRVSGNLQISSFHVVIPDKLVLYLLPVMNASSIMQWVKFTPPSVCYVFVGQEYIIHVKAFSHEYSLKEIFLTESNDLRMVSSTSKYWDVDLAPPDITAAYNMRNSWFFKPVSQGRGLLSVSLRTNDKELESVEVVKVEQEIVVCTRVHFFILKQDHLNEVIRLPWAPGVNQEVQFKAYGGCGKSAEDYHWYSSDMSTISVSTSGFVRAERPGQAIIKVVSRFDPTNYAEVIIEASIPFSMSIQPSFPVEVVVGDEYKAFVTFKTYSGDFYYQCDVFNSFVNWKVVSGQDSFNVLDKRSMSGPVILSYGDGHTYPHGPVCALAYLHASRAGRAELHATFSKLTSSAYIMDGPGILKSSVTISAYSPLIVCEAGNGNQFGGYWVDLTSVHTGSPDIICPGFDELFLVPGSAMDLLLLGGPERWDQRVEHVEKIEIVDQSVHDVVLVRQLPDSDNRVYKILCLSLGNIKVRFSRGNLVGDDHPLPAVAYTELSVFCSLPSAVVLIANEPANTLDKIEAAIRADRGPGQVQSAPLVVANGHTIRISAVGIHQTGKPFANSSSLILKWELNGCELLAHWNDSDSHNKSMYSWERFLVLQNSSGTCTVRATAIGFGETSTSHFLKSDLFFGSVSDTLRDAICLELVAPLKVVPEYILLVFDPEAKANLSILGGTYFIDALSNDTRVVNISQARNDLKSLHLVIGVRGLGTASLSVHDIGFSPPVSASALVKVANVDWVKVLPEEKISIVEGTVQSFDVVAGTIKGHVFHSSQYLFMKIQLHLADGILHLAHNNTSFINGGWRICAPQFSVKALDIGTTTFYVSVRQQSGKEIFSPPVRVEVYKLLQIHPEYIYLVPGASYTLALRGGPKDGVFVEYSSMNSDVVVIDLSSGRISAISPGNATVCASILGNGRTFICEAYGQVEVDIPSAMNLNLQSKQLCVGCKIPVFPSLFKGNLFSFYEVCKSYIWMIDDEKVLAFVAASQLQTKVHDVPFIPDTKSGALNYSLGFMNILHGRSPGKTRVSISFNCEFIVKGSKQKTSFDAFDYVHVIRDPPLALGIPITWILPPFYTTSHFLASSPVPYGLSDTSEQHNVIYSVLNTSSSSNPSEEDTITVSGNRIVTKESNNLACIMAKDQETGRVEIASCVRVAEVAQVRAKVAESPSKSIHLAVLAKVEVAISYCDDLGYTFHEAVDVVPLFVDTNYPDIVSILVHKDENNAQKIILQARGPGKALIRISIDRNPLVADYILVSVGAQIIPNNPVLIAGYHLKFTLVGEGVNDLDSGWWLSSNEAVLSINEKTGEAHARGEGEAFVIFKGLSGDLQTVVTVINKGHIVVTSPAETLTNVPFPTTGYKFSLEFSDKKFDASKSPYNCKVDPPYVGVATPSNDPVTGGSFCLFFPYSPKHLFKSMSEDEKSGEGYLYVYVTAYLRDAPHLSGSARALFVGGFFIPETGKLNLTPTLNNSLITVIGNTDLELHWTARDLLLVRPHRRDGSGIGGRVQFELKVLVDQPFIDKLVFVLPANGQTAAIDVSYDNVADRSRRKNDISRWKSFLSGTNILWTAVITCILVLIVTIIVFLWLLDRPSRSASPRQVESTTAPSGGPSAPNTVIDPPPSPRTPSFMEYVRRTVDETPYYKGNGRRRFDPRYTY